MKYILQFIPRFHSIPKFLIAILLPGICLAQAAQKEYFVSVQKGDDANAGTAEQPFKSIKTAAEKAEGGSIITVLPGWYDGEIVLKAGTADAPTILRAAKPGRVFIGHPVILSGLEKVSGLEYTYVAPCDVKLPTLTEADTGNALRSVASIDDVEELAGGYFVDVEAKKVYVHPSDSAGVAHHLYASLRAGQDGIAMANYTVVDGFALSGFGGAAVSSDNHAHVTAQNCTAYLNGAAMVFTGGSDCLIRGNEAWQNRSTYDQTAQIHVGADPLSERYLIENNTVHDSQNDAIRFYNGAAGNARDCMVRGNLLYNNGDGFYYKVHGEHKNLAAENNVAFDNLGSVEGKIMSHNTYSEYHDLAGGNPSDTDLNVAKLGADPKFTDVAYRDYRLQSDSPARHKAPDGSDLGAFQYDGSVVYVKPDGDDAKVGTSVADAWKTLDHALKNLKAGQTLYIEAGVWKEPLTLSGIKGTAEKPIVIRAHKREKLQFPSLAVNNCENLKIQDVRVTGGGIQVSDSKNIELLRCVSMDESKAGLAIAKSSGVTFDHGVLARNGGDGLEVGAGSSDIALLSTILLENKKANVEVADGVVDFYSNFNAFSSGLEEWQKKNGQDADSVVIPKGEFAGQKTDDFKVRAGQVLSVAGRYTQPVGPDGVVVFGKTAHKPIERAEVISTTRTSVNVAYWTPGVRAGTMIEWGKTPQYGKVFDRTDGYFGDIETFHTISLLGLEPGTQYHFRVGYRDYVKDPDNGLLVWSDDMTFTTTKEDPKPRNLYVSLEGKDTNDGLTPATAWRTLHKASREAHAGDTVTIAPGRYMELLRPLQTGTAVDRRITFRAEKPLTVFLDGGLVKFERDGRSYSIQIQNKALITLENLVCERVQTNGNAGYMDGRGYSGLIGLAGSTGIDIRSCVMDGRDRWMGSIYASEIGTMPGVPQGVRGFTVTDSLLVFGWRAVSYYEVDRACEIRNCILVRGLTAMIVEVGHASKLILKNNIIASLIIGKKNNSLWFAGTRFDSDYNCFVWDDENKEHIIRRDTTGLAGWQEQSKRDMHSTETSDVVLPFLAKFGFGVNGKPEWRNYPDKSPITVEEIILPKDSPLRKAGENGEIIGPRWEKWLNPVGSPTANAK